MSAIVTVCIMRNQSSRQQLLNVVRTSVFRVLRSIQPLVDEVKALGESSATLQACINILLVLHNPQPEGKSHLQL